MSFRQNLLANHATTGVMMLVQLAATPLYLKFLGSSEWGSLNMVLAFATAMLVLEAGLAQSIGRRFSHSTHGAGLSSCLFHSLEWRYLRWGSYLLASGFALVPWWAISEINHGDATTIPFPVGTIVGALAIAASQLVGSLYRSILNAQGDQVRFNLLYAGAAIARHTAAITVAAATHSSSAVTLSMAGCFALETLARRRLVNRHLYVDTATSASNTKCPSPERGISEVHKDTLPLLWAGIFGMLATQGDRLALGILIGAEAVGEYTTAASLSLATLQVVYPVSNAVLPRLGELNPSSTSSNPVLLRRYYQFIAAILVCAWLAGLWMVEHGMRHWLFSLPAESVHRISHLFLLHLGGSTLNALCLPLHSTLLARHQDWTILQSTLVGLAMSTLTMGLSLSSLGAYAASLGWCAFNVTVLACYCAAYNRMRTISHTA